MTDEIEPSRFIDLDFARKSDFRRPSFPHQIHALERLQDWFEKQHKQAGTLLVLPTGSGKTYVAIRFLCEQPLSENYKVLWLAHTHHLLEQAFLEFCPKDNERIKRDGLLVSRVREPRKYLRIRVVSGSTSHSDVSQIEGSDDVLIATLQTINKAIIKNHPSLEKFLSSCGGKLFVVFDEAHHAPANSYRKLINRLYEFCPDMKLLGLTATPTYSDEEKRGWLLELFPQGIIYKETARELMAQGILAKPIPKQVETEFIPRFDEREYQIWSTTNKDIPEDIIDHLARSQERNDCIVRTYLDKKAEFGKTLIFTDRWFQCEYLREAFLHNGIKADAIYTHTGGDLYSPEERAKIRKTDNQKVLEEFRAGRLDVLINVRILTEGTDIPDLKTVFLTRQTTSQILLTQMVGRALRGPKCGGKDEAYIVSFIDDWQQRINWADFTLEGGGVVDTGEERKYIPLQMISIELIRRLARMMSAGKCSMDAPFLTYLPIGWYWVEHEFSAETDSIEHSSEKILVYENEKNAFESLFNYLTSNNELLSMYSEYDLTYTSRVSEKMDKLRDQFFLDQNRHIGSELSRDIFTICRHIAQYGTIPKFFSFNDRENFDIDRIADLIIDQKLDRQRERDYLLAEFSKPGTSWRMFYLTFERFKYQVDCAINYILYKDGSQTNEDASYVLYSCVPTVDDSPLTKDRIAQIKKRDNYKCLCCGENNKRRLKIDHIIPWYYEHNNDPNNLQTLCAKCNSIKNLNTINFRSNCTLLKAAPLNLPALVLPKGKAPLKDWTKHLRRIINMFYQCGAVVGIKTKRHVSKYQPTEEDVCNGSENGSIGSTWVVELYAGNNPDWIKPFLPSIADSIKGIRKVSPDRIEVFTPSFPRSTLKTSDSISIEENPANIIKEETELTNDEATVAELPSVGENSERWTRFLTDYIQECCGEGAVKRISISDDPDSRYFKIWEVLVEDSVDLPSLVSEMKLLIDRIRSGYKTKPIRPQHIKIVLSPDHGTYISKPEFGLQIFNDYIMISPSDNDED